MIRRKDLFCEASDHWVSPIFQSREDLSRFLWFLVWKRGQPIPFYRMSCSFKGFSDKNLFVLEFFYHNVIACSMHFTNFIFFWRILQKLIMWSYLLGLKKFRKSECQNFWNPSTNLGCFCKHTKNKISEFYKFCEQKFYESHEKNMAILISNGWRKIRGKQFPRRNVHRIVRVEKFSGPSRYFYKICVLPICNGSWASREGATLAHSSHQHFLGEFCL